MKIIKTLALLFFASNAFAQCWTTVNTSSYSTIGLRTDGTFWGWGINSTGVLGFGAGSETFTTIFPPTQIGTDNDWSDTYAVAATTTLAIKTNRRLHSWSNNNYGQCGNGTFGLQNDVLVTQQIGTDEWKAVACSNSGYYSLVIKTELFGQRFFT